MFSRKSGLLIAAVFALSLGQASANTQQATTPKPQPATNLTLASPQFSYSVDGTASWYGGSFHGQRDARGEVFNENALTAAHRTLPLNSFARVINLDNGRQVVVRITDRGPYAHHRLIDVSRAAARQLDFISDGTAHVSVRALGDVTPPRAR